MLKQKAAMGKVKAMGKVRVSRVSLSLIAELAKCRCKVLHKLLPILDWVRFVWMG